LPDGHGDDGVELKNSCQVHDPALRPVAVRPSPVLCAGGHEDVGDDGEDGADGGNEGVAKLQDLAQEGLVLVWLYVCFFDPNDVTNFTHNE